MSIRILAESEEGGYPLEYLLSRIRGRRVSLISDWESLVRAENPLDAVSSARRGKTVIGSADGLWRVLLAEYRWVFSQMDKVLREVFRPFFIYSEIRVLFFCLRHMTADETVKREQLLFNSLFSKQFKKILGSSKDILTAVEDVEEVFIGLSAEFKGLKAEFLKNGLKGVEETLTNTYLVYVTGSALHPLMRAFFVRLIDARNLLALYKYMRWEVAESPRFIKGGRISERRLRENKERGNIFGVIALIRTVTGVEILNPDASGVENALYTGMTRFLRRTSRETSGIGFILDYLWRCSIETRNLGVVLYGGDAGREAVLSELVR